MIKNNSVGLFLFAIVAIVALNFSLFSNAFALTWTEQTSSGSRVWSAITSSSDGTKLAAVDATGSSGYIYTSTDSGVNWTERTSAGQRNWTGIASSADGTKLAATVFNGAIYTSTDSGVNWTERTGAGSRRWGGIVSSADGTKLAVYNRHSTGYVYTSTDSGVNWTERTSMGQQTWTSMASSADGTKLVVASNFDNDVGGLIYTSIDSGATWTERTSAGSGRSWQALASSADGMKLAAGDRNGGETQYILTSIDGGVTWTEQTTSGTRGWKSITSSSDGTKLAAVAEIDITGDPVDGYVYLSSDSGVTWTEDTASGQRNWKSITSSSDGMKLAAAVGSNATADYIYTATIPDTTPASLTSFTSSTTNGTYDVGATINITANFDEEISATSTMTVVLDTGVSVVLNVASSASLSGTYTVASGNMSSDLTVSSITSASITDLLSNNSTAYSVPSAPNNIADTKEIVVSAPIPTTPAVVTGGMVPLFFLSQTPTPVVPLTPQVPQPYPTPTQKFIFTRNLGLMMKHVDVKELQKYLNTHGFKVATQGPGSPGNETDYFGRMTRIAISKLQEAYAEEILKPIGLKKGTGYFGPSTRAFVNK